jgi:hypothetical protein
MTGPQLYIDIINVLDSLEAYALRSALEWFGAQVTLHLVGQASDIVRILGDGGSHSNNIVLMCHGNDEGLILPELAPALEAEQPYHGVLTPGDIGAFAHLPGSVVLNTGCSLGAPAFAEAFLQAGVRAYIGARGDPHGSSSLFYAIHFYYERIFAGRDIRTAHKLASSHDEQTGMFTLYEREDAVERPRGTSRS